MSILGPSLIAKTHSGKGRIRKSILGRSRIDHRNPAPPPPVSAFPFTCNFTTPPDGQISPPTGTDFPGSVGLCKGYSENNGTIDQTSGDAIHTTPAPADSAWISTPINLVSEFPTFTIEFDLQIDSLSGVVQLDYMLIASPELTSNAGNLEPARALFWLSAFGSGVIGFRYRNTTGTLVNHALFPGSMETGKIIECSLKRGATQSFWNYDIQGVTANGFKTLGINNGLIQSLVGARAAFGDLFTVVSNGAGRIRRLKVLSPTP